MNNPQLASTTVTLDDTNQVAQTSYQYDKYNNITDTKQYDWGNGAPGALLRETQTTYIWANENSTYAGEYTAVGDLPVAAYLPSLPDSQTILDGSGNPVAKASWSYDGATPQADPGMVGHDNANFGGYAPRGNLTFQGRWMTTYNGWTWVYASATFDIAGNLLTQQDFDGNTTTFSYADPQNTYAHVTKITNALNQSTSASYDYSTGKIISTTGLNGEQAYYSYNDPLDRITTIQSPNARFTTYSYPNYTTVAVQQDQNEPDDGFLKSQTLYDGFGRISEVDTYETSSQYIARIRKYDAMGRIASAINPSRSGDGLNYATTYLYDSLGRIKSVAASDGVTSIAGYNGNSTTLTDPAGRTKSYTFDGLGELEAVAETVQSGSVANTYYSYDVSGTSSASARPPAPAPRPAFSRTIAPGTCSSR